MKNELEAIAASLVAVSSKTKGSGAVIGHRDDDASLVLTAAHNIEDENSITVTLGRGRKQQEVEAVISKMDRTLDLALLRTKGRLGCQALGISASTPGHGETVYLAHCPNGHWDVRSEGRMQGPKYGYPGKVLFTSTGLWPGSSGGPIGDYNGGLVGIIHGIEWDDDRPVLGLCVAISLRVIKAFLKAD